MAWDIVWYIAFAISVIVHQSMFAWFGIMLLRFFTVPVAPYSAAYLASITLGQAIYNGCPVSDINNFFGAKIGLPLISNAFWGGVFGSMETVVRVFSVFVAVILYYYAYRNWYKLGWDINFNNLFKSRKLEKILD